MQRSTIQPVIEVRGLTKTYARGAAASRALNGVDLDIYPRQVTLLMGPSGSGKTTLVSIMGCILRATSGSVKLAGLEVTRLSEKELLPAVRLRHIGFVFQGFNLFPTLTAVENVEVALELKRVARAERRMRAGALLDEVGLGDKHRAYPADMSGGEKQRVAIARALAGDPDVILADEPTAALDKDSGRTVLDMLRTLAHDKGRAVVIVTHDSRTLDFADRVVHIEDGRIAADGVAGGELNLVAQEGGRE
jgi:putative ABC transport system ATP-binding protein